jgi:hypothetical protein
MMQLDLAAPELEIKKADGDALKIYGHIDVLASIAGYALSSPIEDVKYVTCFHNSHFTDLTRNPLQR